MRSVGARSSGSRGDRCRGRGRHGRRGPLVGGDEPQQQAIEEGGRIAVQSGQARRVDRSATADAGELGEERLAGGDEEGDGLGQADAGGGEAAGLVIDDGPRFALESIARLGVAGVSIEVVDERGDQPPAVLAVGLAVGVVSDGCGRGPVAASVAMASAA